jgi:branched-chain amino acid transport system substrate-binding protein
MTQILEFLTDHRGRIESVHGGPPPPDLVAYARGFLLLNRHRVQFLYRAAEPWLSVVVERTRRRGEQYERALIRAVPAELPQGITRREIEVLTLLSLGLSNPEIGDRLGTSRRTVSTQVERLLHKLGQVSRAGLASLVVDSHLLALPVPGGIDGVAHISVVSVERFAGMVDDVTQRIPSGSKTVDGPRPILIGTLASLTGQANDEGEELVRGAALAVEEINANGGVAGRSLEHLVADADLYDPDAVRAAMQRLIDAGVDAITTHYSSAENPFLLEMAANYGRPFLHVDTFERHVDLVRSNPRRYGMVFQTCPSEKYYAMAFVRFLRDLGTLRNYHPKERRMALVEMDTPSAHIGGNGFEPAVASAGWSIVSRDSAPFRQSDWEDVARRLVESRAEVILVAHFITDEIAELQRQLHAANFTGLVHYVYAASSPRFVEQLGDLANGVVWSSVTNRTDSAIARTFQRNYAVRYGVEPGPAQSSSAYDQVQLLATAWRQNGGTDSAGVSAALREILYRGLNGTYYLGEDGQSPLSYPDGTIDPTIGMPLLTCQIQPDGPVVLSPAPFGSMSRLQFPGMHGAVDR